MSRMAREEVSGMQWWQFALLGGVGGMLAEFMSLFKQIATWQAARRAPSGTLRVKPAPLRRYVDIPAHVWMLAMRGLLGMASAGAFAAGDQLKGAFAAVALGYGGPVVFERLGQLPLVDSLVNGAGPAPQPAVVDTARPAPGTVRAPQRPSPQEQLEVAREH